MARQAVSDFFEFFQSPRETNADLLVRAFQPRQVEVISAGQVCPLPTVAAHLDDYGRYAVHIEHQYEGKRRTVELTLQLKAATVHIHPSKRAIATCHKTQALLLVMATEVACVEVESQADCFDADHALCWSLPSSLPIDSLEEVKRIIRFYALRWRMERFHFALKSGAFNVEKLQFDDPHTLVNALTFYSVVAWQLLALTYALCHDPNNLPRCYLTQTN